MIAIIQQTCKTVWDMSENMVDYNHLSLIHHKLLQTELQVN